MMLSAQPALPMQPQEDLASLFARNLVLNPELAARQQAQVQEQLHLQQQRMEIQQNQIASPMPSPAPEQPAAAPIIYSISQHYHHSTHIPLRQQGLEQQAPPRRSSEPPQSEQESCEGMLRAHGIDPSTLGPSQTQLFRIAAPDQKARLVELWSIFPPANRDENPSVAWNSTTMEQEEQMARMRYERQQQENAMNTGYVTLQSTEGRWEAEPYMQSGYEELMRREEEESRLRTDRPKDAYSHFGVAVGGAREEAACSYSRATDPVYGIENRYSAPASHGTVSWEGVSRIHAPAGTADAMDII
ncbi:uncharacterized protein DNG_00348 [Cephalotrichum gorgonifer]|uniref:Uncharacterized protein n=1 Tax=Cephalotrichum gorgonifer TaxID=2041049 RepID=A0AAE8SQN6_9PEZI|nr:uncharacterized protein DNG_00348 [Cephalotrichum gorgonifer]